MFSINNSIRVLCGNYLNLTVSTLIKKFYNSFGCSNIFYENNFYKETDFRFNYLLNHTMADLETLDYIIFINANPRLEAPVLNSRFRRNYMNNVNVKFFSFGNSFNYSAYPIFNIGNSTLSLMQFFQGVKISFNPIMHTIFLNHRFNKNNNGLILIGASLFDRSDVNEIIKTIINFKTKVKEIDFKYGFLSDFLGRLSFYENGLVTKRSFVKDAKKKTFYHILASHSAQPFTVTENSFAVFQGVFQNLLPCSINLFLPSKSHLEQANIYINMEGKIRSTKAAITPFRMLHADEEILVILLILKRRFLISNFSIVPKFQAVLSFFKNLLFYKRYFINSYHFLEYRIRKSYSKDLKENFDSNNITNYVNTNLTTYGELKVINSLFSRKIYNYYSEDVFTKNSKVMSLAAMKLPNLLEN